MALQIRLRSAKSKPPDNHQGNERPPAQQQKFTELEHEGKRWQRMTVLLVVVIGVALLGGVVIASLLSVRKQSRLKGRIRQLEDQLDELRKSPPGPHEDRLDH